MNTPRPLFFSDLIPFDTDRHRNLRLPAERKNFAFAAHANLLPLNVAEVGQAMRHYPVVFVADGESTALVAVTGLQPGSNHFVDASGEWRAGAYIPAYVRGYPFIAIRPAESGEPILAIDPNAADFKHDSGKPLLNRDGQASEQLRGIMAYQAEYRQLAERTQVITKALKDAGVLEEGSLEFQARVGGEPQKIGGFLVVSEQKLKALSSGALKKLMDADALGLAYAQLLSMASLGNIFAAPSARQPETTSVSADKPRHSQRSRKQPE